MSLDPISRVDDDTLRIFESLESNAAFDRLIEFFRAELAAQSKQNDVAQDDKTMLRGQGRNHVYRFLIECHEHAREQIQKRKQTRKE
jgi:predicted HicB family RNase H-like nuclease